MFDPNKMPSGQQPEDFNIEKIEAELSQIESVLAEYKKVASAELGANYISPDLSSEINTLLRGNQILKGQIQLLWGELQDAKEAHQPKDKEILLENLRTDLADFEASFVVEVEDAA